MPRKIFSLLLASLMSGAICFPAVAESDLSREEQLLMWTVGEWYFELGQRTGTRTVLAEYPSHLISYKETFSGTDVHGTGFIGYAPETNLFYSFGAHSIPGTYSLKHGKLDAKEDKITFVPQGDESERPFEVIWQRVSDNQFSSTFVYILEDGSRDEQWVATFSRADPDD